MIEKLVECLVCGASGLVPFLDLGDLPLVNALLKASEGIVTERRFPLSVAYCPRCSHVQLRHIVSPQEMFSEYLYVTGSSDSVIAHARNLARLVRTEMELDDRFVVEIGSNDGTVLEAFKDRSAHVLGVEPAANIAQLARERGIPTVSRFFDEELAADLSMTYGKAAVILARNVLAHVPELRQFVSGIAKLLARDGLAFVEVHYLVDLLEQVEFDTIYHEHMSYFSVTAADRLFRDAGLDLVDVRRITLHGGSLLLQLQVQGGPRRRRESVDAFLSRERRLGALAPKRFESFAARVAKLKELIPQFVRAVRARQMRVAAYGAAAKGNALLNVCGLSRDDIEFIVDRNPYKHGLFAPGTGIPILPVRRLYEEDIDCLLLLAWNFADEIIRQQWEFEARGGVFVVPIPYPQFVTSGDLERPELRHLRSSGMAE